MANDGDADAFPDDPVDGDANSRSVGISDPGARDTRTNDDAGRCLRISSATRPASKPTVVTDKPGEEQARVLSFEASRPAGSFGCLAPDAAAA